MLSILRVLPMARIAQFVLLLVLIAAGIIESPQALAERARRHATAASAQHAKATHSKARSTSARFGGSAVRHKARAKAPARAKSAVRSVKKTGRRPSAKTLRKRGVRRTSLAVAGRNRTAAHLKAADWTETRSRRAVVRASSADVLPERVDPSIAAAQLAGDLSPIRAEAESRVNPIPAFMGGGIASVAPLRGSFESLARQNEKTDADGLERILDDADLNDRIARKMLVPVPASSALTINGNLPENRRYCRPWTATFLSDLAMAHDKRFHSPLYVSSAVRSVEYQKQLMRHNGNAAAAEGEVVSPHVTGATIDIAKSRMSQSEIYWMRHRLGDLQDAGKIDVEEEFRQACFHITVYKSYVGLGPLHKKHHPVVPEVGPDDDEPADAADAGAGR